MFRSSKNNSEKIEHHCYKKIFFPEIIQLDRKTIMICQIRNLIKKGEQQIEWPKDPNPSCQRKNQYSEKPSNCNQRHQRNNQYICQDSREITRSDKKDQDWQSSQSRSYSRKQVFFSSLIECLL